MRYSVACVAFPERLGPAEHTYFIFFALSTALYSLAAARRTGSVAVFVLIFFCIILTMYGGNFATIPA